MLQIAANHRRPSLGLLSLRLLSLRLLSPGLLSAAAALRFAALFAGAALDLRLHFIRRCWKVRTGIIGL
jgi:hypothetical protein